MKKNLIALAVAAAVIAPTFASAGVSVYGRAQVEIGQVDPETGDSAIGMTDNSMGRVGVKASEDLGNGWKGLAKFEFKADTNDGASDTVVGGATGSGKSAGIALTNRETMVGLSSKGVGKFSLGRLKSPYKYAGGVKYDPFVATTLEARGNGGMSKPAAGGQYGHSSFLSSTIGYNGKFGPVKLGIVYGPSENDGRLSISAMLAQKSWEVFFAMIDEGDAGGSGTAGALVAGDSTYSAMKFGGKVKFAGMHTIVAQYELTDESTQGGSNESEPTYLFVGYQAKVGKNTFVAEIGQNDKDVTGSTANDEDFLALGVIHKFTKMTRIFAGYRSTATDNNSEQSVISVGLRKDFK